MQEPAALQIDAYMSVEHAGLEKHQIARSQMAFVYAFSRVCLQLRRSRQDDAELRFECHVHESGAIDSFFAQAADFIFCAFPLTVLGIQFLPHQLGIADVDPCAGRVSGLRRAPFRCVAASGERGDNERACSPVFHAALPFARKVPILDVRSQRLPVRCNTRLDGTAVRFSLVACSRGVLGQEKEPVSVRQAEADEVGFVHEKAER